MTQQRYKYYSIFILSKAAIQVANLLTIAENLDGVDSSDAVLALASQIASSTTTLDLTNSSVIETFFRRYFN